MGSCLSLAENIVTYYKDWLELETIADFFYFSNFLKKRPKIHQGLLSMLNFI